jgi:RNA polymerase sigma-70 factor, ECF subfamily
MIRALNSQVDNREAEFENEALPHLDALHRAAVCMTRNKQDAEDLVQETYLRAYRAFNTFNRGTNCRAWLFKILTNSNINRVRRASSTHEKLNFESVKGFMPATDESREAPSSEEIGSLDEVVDEQVKQALEQVPDNFRRPLVLSAVEGLHYNEIARILDCPIGTVMSRIYRGRQLLRKKLKDYAHTQGYRVATA